MTKSYYNERTLFEEDDAFMLTRERQGIKDMVAQGESVITERKLFSQDKHRLGLDIKRAQVSGSLDDQETMSRANDNSSLP